MTHPLLFGFIMGTIAFQLARAITNDIVRSRAAQNHRRPIYTCAECRARGLTGGCSFSCPRYQR